MRRSFIYRGTIGGHAELNIVKVSNNTLAVDGITVRVVQEDNWINNRLIEDTLDYYAQDDTGNVWYMGEYASQYKDGVVTGHTGSWQSGVGGAQPGYIMEAHPSLGDAYLQENFPGQAQDTAQIISLTASVSVPYGTWKGNVLETKSSPRLNRVR